MYERSEWLASLKVGDTVAETGPRGEFSGLLKITRETALYWVVGRPNYAGEVHERKYRKSDGNLPGGGTWGTDSIEDPNSEQVIAARERVARSRALDKVTDRSFYKGLRSEQLGQVIALVEGLQTNEASGG